MMPHFTYRAVVQTENSSIYHYSTTLPSTLSPGINTLNLSVFRTNKISEGLWLAFIVVDPVSMCIVTVVVMAVGILGWANIIHLQHITTLRASFNWAISGHLCESLSERIHID
jgi:hypothetical protein